VEHIAEEQDNAEYLKQKAVEEIKKLRRKFLRKVRLAYSVQLPVYPTVYNNQTPRLQDFIRAICLICFVFFLL